MGTPPCVEWQEMLPWEQITVPVTQNTALSTNTSQPPFALIGPLVDHSSLLPRDD